MIRPSKLSAPLSRARHYSVLTFSPVRILGYSALAASLVLAPVDIDLHNGEIAVASVWAKSCFTGTTLILMADGTKVPIQELKEGDLVMGAAGTANRVQQIEHVPLAGRTLYGLNGLTPFVTAEHPFLSTDGWRSLSPAATAIENDALEVSRLMVGDQLLQLQALNVVPGDSDATARDLSQLLELRPVMLEEITSEALPLEITLFNLILDGDHSYIAADFVVHNKGGDGGGDGGGDSGGDSDSDDSGDDDNSGSGSSGSDSDDDDRSGSSDDDNDDFDSADHDDDRGDDSRRGRGLRDSDDDDSDNDDGRRGRGLGEFNEAGQKLRGDGTVDDSQPGQVRTPGDDDFNAAGQKLRGDGTVDDSQPGQVRTTGDDDFNAAGQKLRGDGTVDDSQPGQVRTAGDDDFNAAGQKLRGDGTVDDSQPGQVRTPGDDDFNAAGQKLRGDGSVDDSQPLSQQQEQSVIRGQWQLPE